MSQGGDAGAKAGNFIKGGAKKVHGLGEALRGNINDFVDTATGTQKNPKNQATIEKGVDEIESGHQGMHRAANQPGSMQSTAPAGHHVGHGAGTGAGYGAGSDAGYGANPAAGAAAGTEAGYGAGTGHGFGAGTDAAYGVGTDVPAGEHINAGGSYGANPAGAAGGGVGQGTGGFAAEQPDQYARR